MGDPLSLNVKSPERGKLSVPHTAYNSQDDAGAVSKAGPTGTVSVSHSRRFSSVWGRLRGASAVTTGKLSTLPTGAHCGCLSSRGGLNVAFPAR